MPTHRELLESLRDGFNDLTAYDETELDRLKKRGQVLARIIFGEEGDYPTQLRKTRFHPQVYPASAEYRASCWKAGRNAAVSIVGTMLEELDLKAGALMGNASDGETTEVEKSNRVFVVHGHDNEMKQAVARTVEHLGLEAVILHEKPNRGQTIIEKIERFSDVGFAVVLLSPDDTGYSNSAGEDAAKLRARQNVILELGYFAGKLGRENVIALHRGSEDEKLELPSDYDGVLYTPYDGDSGTWRGKLVAELRESGYSVSADDL